LLRGLALLVMIEVHVFNDMLNPAIKQTGWFHILNFINGFVAPSFLFISGFAFSLAGSRKLEEYRKFGYQFWRQLGRIALIWLAGYSLHIPFLSITKMKNQATSSQMMDLYAVDVLECIACGLLIMFVFRLFIKKDKIYEWFLIALCVSVVLFSPIINSLDFTQWIQLPFADYLNARQGSLFPLFPWVAFMAFGGICGVYYLQAKAADNEKMYFKYLGISGIVAIIIGGVVISEIFPIFTLSKILKPNPYFMLLRFGIVAVLLVLCWLWTEWRSTEKAIVIDVGRESLLVYWLHLHIIYRKLWNNKSLADMSFHNYSVSQASVFTLTMIAVMIVIAVIWSAVKKRYPLAARNVTLTIVFCTILWFFIH
jgi:uncharacterized membrane protein